MITSAIYAGRTYIQGFVILLISCLAFSQDFNFGSDSANASNSELINNNLPYTNTSNMSRVSQNLTHNKNLQSDHSEYNVDNLTSGAYIVKLQTANDSVMTKKIIIE